ncbi:hypothetical protein BKA70DRAFT_1234985 [Coprinopsis sp. MPI-PUGE-AT-0042]|nr:hypothetical protein BKA70DRAFT_1234985 [Coprinopsis sp. MPI-PUGE-AT-0042]
MVEFEDRYAIRRCSRVSRFNIVQCWATLSYEGYGRWQTFNLLAEFDSSRCGSAQVTGCLGVFHARHGAVTGSLQTGPIVVDLEKPDSHAIDERPRYTSLPLSHSFYTHLNESAWINLSWVKAYAYPVGLNTSPNAVFVADRDMHVLVSEVVQVQVLLPSVNSHSLIKLSLSMVPGKDPRNPTCRDQGNRHTQAARPDVEENTPDSVKGGIGSCSLRLWKSCWRKHSRLELGPRCWVFFVAYEESPNSVHVDIAIVRNGLLPPLLEPVHILSPVSKTPSKVEGDVENHISRVVALNASSSVLTVLIDKIKEDPVTVLPERSEPTQDVRSLRYKAVYLSCASPTHAASSVIKRNRCPSTPTWELSCPIKHEQQRPRINRRTLTRERVESTMNVPFNVGFGSGLGTRWNTSIMCWCPCGESGQMRSNDSARVPLLDSQLVQGPG